MATFSRPSLSVSLCVRAQDMLIWIKRFFFGRRQKAEAIARAMRNFEDATGLRPLGAAVLHSDGLAFVIRVRARCGPTFAEQVQAARSGQTILVPPIYFRVHRGSAQIDPLSFEEVEQYGEKRLL